MNPRLLLLVLAITVSCSGDPVAPGGSPDLASAYDVTLESFFGYVGFSFGSSTTDMYAGNNMILHYDGRTWSPLPVPQVSSNIYGGWTLANGDVLYWNYSRIYRYDGAVWDYVAVPYGFNDLFALPSGEIFAAGSSGEVYRYNGESWATDSVAAGNMYFSAIHGTSADNVYAVGSRGTISRYDGSAWHTTTLDSLSMVSDVAAIPDGSAFVTASTLCSDYLCGPQELLRVSSDGSVAPEALGEFQPDELCASGRHVYAYGSSVDGYALYHSDGGAWSREFPGGAGRRRLEWGTPDGTVFTTDTDGRLWKTNHAGSERVLGGGAEAVTEVWSSPEGDVFAVGEGARRFDGTRWIDLEKQAITSRTPIAVGGSSSNDVWAVGDDMILHYDGHAWRWASGGFGKRLWGVWSDGHRVIAVGSDGSIVSREGNGWKLTETSVSSTLLAVSGWDGGAVATGDEGVVLVFDGAAWREEPRPVDWSISEVVAFNRNRFIAAGDNPWVVLDYRNGVWKARAITSREGRDYGDWNTALWAPSENDVYVAQYGGDIHHFDGHEWTALPRVVFHGLRAAAVGPGGDVFALSDSALLKYHRR